MTAASTNRIRAMYLRVIGYDPLIEGWSAAEALDILKEYRTETRLSL